MGESEFDAFYAAQFGERWPALREALLAPAVSVGLSEGLEEPYYLDEASVIAARQLGVQPGDEVLDLCAAPGGKSLVLAAAMGPDGTLTANDRSSARRARLRRVVDRHLPEALCGRVRITSHDASKWGLYQTEAYDRVLVDVPCSSERHVLASPPHLSAWTRARTRNLSVQAYAMLAAAGMAVRRGGYILYSTCALSDLENDRVVARLLSKKRGAFVLEPVAAICGEPTELGWIILPDRCGGRGPLYFSKLRRLEAEAPQ